MKRIIAVMAMIFAVEVCFGQQVTVVIAPFEARSGVSTSDAETITDLFMAELVATRRAQIVDRSSVDKIQGEMQFQMSDWSNDQKTAQLGQAASADSIVRGQIAQLGGRLIVTATMLNINTMKVSNPARMQLNSIDEIFDRLPSFVAEMVLTLPTQVPPYGLRVTAVTTDRIDLTWDSAGAGITYKLYYSTENKPTEAKFFPVSGTSSGLINLSSNTTYYFWVSSIKDGIEGEKSAVVWAKTDIFNPLVGKWRAIIYDRPRDCYMTFRKDGTVEIAGLNASFYYSYKSNIETGSLENATVRGTYTLSSHNLKFSLNITGENRSTVQRGMRAQLIEKRDFSESLLVDTTYSISMDRLKFSRFLLYDAFSLDSTPAPYLSLFSFAKALEITSPDKSSQIEYLDWVKVKDAN